ncbi:IS66 family transposase [Phocaeicola sartorii]|uniref:Transposase IS66 central domain-containing protein n=1 Tax=Phocaeicola sartorii TaxID=671267 RepID=A0A4V6REJ7_9BACT|nr:hypothetical protein E5339_15130 [Phocaeicola sartorii]
MDSTPRIIYHQLKTKLRQCYSQHKTLQDFIPNLQPKKEFLLAFLTSPSMPTDNNASERAVQPVKAKMKVSGQFKNSDGAYTTLHSIIQTARKNNRNPFAALAEFARR